MRAGLASVCAMALLVACEKSRISPLAPAPTTAPPATRPAYTVFGVVRANGSVAGASVAALDAIGTAITAAATTDGDGHYSIPGVTAEVGRMPPLLSASKPGYFTDIRFADSSYAPISKDTQLDFELEPLVSISLGEIVRERPGGDSICSHWGYGSGACQRFALTVPASGTLAITVSAAVRNFDFDVVGPGGTFVLYDASSASPLRVSIPVDAGSTYELRLALGTLTRNFELTTALR